MLTSGIQRALIARRWPTGWLWSGGYLADLVNSEVPPAQPLLVVRSADVAAHWPRGRFSPGVTAADVIPQPAVSPQQQLVVVAAANPLHTRQAFLLAGIPGVPGVHSGGADIREGHQRDLLSRYRAAVLHSGVTATLAAEPPPGLRAVTRHHGHVQHRQQAWLWQGQVPDEAAPETPPPCNRLIVTPFPAIDDGAGNLYDGLAFDPPRPPGGASALLVVRQVRNDYVNASIFLRGLPDERLTGGANAQVIVTANAAATLPASGTSLVEVLAAAASAGFEAGAAVVVVSASAAGVLTATANDGNAVTVEVAAEGHTETRQGSGAVLVSVMAQAVGVAIVPGVTPGTDKIDMRTFVQRKVDRTADYRFGSGTRTRDFYQRRR